MAATAKATLSLVKRSLPNDLMPQTAFRKVVMMHYSASGGDSGINTASLVAPLVGDCPDFVQPSASIRASTNLFAYKENVTVLSNMRTMQQFLDYKVTSNSQITFRGFVAQAGEIFTITVDTVPVTGAYVVDANPVVATGTLLANQTDILLPSPIPTAKYPSQQIGAVMLIVDRKVMMRNVSPTTNDSTADFYEVDASGLCSILRMNAADAENDRTYMVVSLGLYIERPTGSMMAYIESLQGQINNLLPYCVDAFGCTLAELQMSQPSNVDLGSYGAMVYALARTFYQNTAFTAEVDKKYSVDTTNGIVAITLPTASAMKQIRFEDAKGTWQTNKATMTGLIQGVSQTLDMDTQGGICEVRWIDDTYGYNVYRLVP